MAKLSTNIFAFRQIFLYNNLVLKNRYLTPFIVEDLRDKMVFIVGPRQVGKTTLCRSLQLR